jgi:pimeloyl-ACP methyl ester carboxylesterase
VVLVHGAWHGAWCWDRVVDGLGAGGVATLAIDLPGHGEDRRPLTDLHGDAAAVREAIDAVEGEVVLVGHSYGGVVVTEAGVHPQVRHVVYLAALNVDAGETAGTAAAGDPEAESLDHSSRPQMRSFLHRLEDGSWRMNPDGAGLLLYNDCDAESVAWAASRLTPQRMENMAQSPTAVAWRDRPSTYIVCSHDNILHPGLQRILARRATASVEWPTSHSPFLSRPELVVDLLSELAAGR